MSEQMVTLAEAGQLLERRLGRVLSRQEVRWLIRKSGEIEIHKDAVVVEVTRRVLADAVRVIDIELIARTAEAIDAAGETG